MATRIKRTKTAGGTVSFGAHVRVKGFKPVWKSFDTNAEAVAWRDALTAELKGQRQGGGARSDITSLTLAQLNAAYLEDPATVSDHAPRYVEGLKRSLAWFTLHFGTVRLLDFGVLQLRQARDMLIAGTVRGGKKRAGGTITRRLAAQRSAWNWARAAGLVAKDRSWPPRLMLRPGKARTRYLSDTELAALLKAAKEKSAVLYAAVLLAIGTGIRKGELLRLAWPDVDLPRSRITLLLTKNGEARSVHLPPTAAQALKDLKTGKIVSAKNVFVAESTGKPLTENQLDKLWRPTREAIGLRDFRWHDLRHTAASFLAQAGSSLLEIGSVLGHRSAQVTLKYAHLVQGAKVTGSDKLDEKLRGA